MVGYVSSMVNEGNFTTENSEEPKIWISPQHTGG
jgi:hypothetical protein